jgi:hypothetical protein
MPTGRRDSSTRFVERVIAWEQEPILRVNQMLTASSNIVHLAIWIGEAKWNVVVSRHIFERANF